MPLIRATSTRAAVVIVLTGILSLPVAAQDLVIHFDGLHDSAKEGFDDTVASFREANPDLDIEVKITDLETHKLSIGNFLIADPPDVTSWYPGNRMGPFVDDGLFEDISDLWESEGWAVSFASSLETMTRNGKQWGVPYSYYQWGIYYRTDVLEEHSLEPPSTWDDLLAVCATLKEADITCFSTGTKALWPAAGIFDYLNLRTNGYNFHMRLTAGKVPYTDGRVRKVFGYWRQLIDNGYILNNHAALDWQDAILPFVLGQTAMYVIGNFAVEPMKAAGLTEKQFDYIPFPIIDPNVERAEDAPTDALFIPAGAKNKMNARKFLSFVASPAIQTQWNKTLGQLPPNANAEAGKSKFLRHGFETLSSAARLAQFYDRDVSAEMAQAGMEGFKEFMIDPDRLDAILERLETIRRRTTQ